MSSGSERERPSGIIRHGNRVVGAVSISLENEQFIAQFNHFYRGMRMECCKLEPDAEAVPAERDKRDERFRMPVWSRQQYLFAPPAAVPPSPVTRGW